MTGRTTAYGRAAFAWAVKRDVVNANPFADLPVPKGIAKRGVCSATTDRRRDRGDCPAAGDAAAPYGAIVGCWSRPASVAARSPG
jgi:hypothetical protein